MVAELYVRGRSIQGPKLTLANYWLILSQWKIIFLLLEIDTGIDWFLQKEYIWKGSILTVALYEMWTVDCRMVMGRLDWPRDDRASSKQKPFPVSYLWDKDTRHLHQYT